MQTGLLRGLRLDTNVGLTTAQHRLMDALDRMSQTAEKSSDPKVRKLAARAAKFYGDELRNL